MTLFTQTNVTRLLVVLVVILSLALGYYHGAAQSWRNKYTKLKKTVPIYVDVPASPVLFPSPRVP